MNGLGMASLHTPGHVAYIVSDLQDADFRMVGEVGQPTSEDRDKRLKNMAHTTHGQKPCSEPKLLCAAAPSLPRLRSL